jgi:hypothetical protein
MARRYPYDTTPDALFHPAKGKQPSDFFQDCAAADLARLPWLCAELSRLAYGDEDLVTKALPNASLRFVGWLGGNGLASNLRHLGTNGFVAERADGTTFVVFRGTEAISVLDIITDLRTLPATWPAGGQVHNGFKNAYQAVAGTLAGMLARRAGPLVFAGHSLGAALATLGASEFRDRRPSLFTYGSPRVGDAAFITTLADVTHRRHVDCCDIVAHVPPERFDRQHITELLGVFTGGGIATDALGAAMAAILNPSLRDASYMHAGQVIYIDRTQRVHDPAPSPADMHADQDAACTAYGRLNLPVPSGLGDWKVRLGTALGVAKVPFRPLADHAPINYVGPLAR